MPGTMLGPENSMVEDPRLLPLRSSHLLKKTEKLDLHGCRCLFVFAYVCRERGG